jgi:hypothetical protein
VRLAHSEATVSLPAEPWEVRDAVQFATFQLFDRRDPTTAHEVVVKPADDALGEPAVVATVEDPYNFDTSTFQISSAIDGGILTISTHCALAE